MKRAFIIVFIVFGLASAACTKNPVQEEPVAPPKGYFQLTAGPQTKSVIDSDGKVLWSRTDTLIVYDREGKGAKFSTNDDNSETAAFSTPAWNGGIPEYAACYNPDCGEDFILDSSSEGILTIKFRTVQNILRPGTCSPQATASAGKVSYNGNGSYSIEEMKNVMAFISINVTGTDVRKIEIEAPGGEVMAGWVNVDCDRLLNGDDDFWTVAQGHSQSNKVTLTCSDSAASQDGCFLPGKYYFSLMPQFYSKGLRFTMTGVSGETILSRTSYSDEGLQVSRSSVISIQSSIDDILPDTITLDLDFYNEKGTNPLGFGDLSADVESSEGETYEFEGFPFVLCKGKESGAGYTFKTYSLIYPAGVTGKCLMFKKSDGWMKVPGIRGRYLQSVTFEHGNGYVKQMAIKKSISPSEMIAYTTNSEEKIATASGPSSETISFYSNGTTNINVKAVTEEATPYYLQFITDGGTRVYKIKLVYTKTLPPVPGPSGTDTGFPSVFINTADSAPIVSKDDYLYGSFRYTDVNGINPGNGLVEENDVTRFRGRGNTSWSKFPKKPYKIKFDGKVSLFGLPKDKEWCLLANYSDKTLMRNLVAMKISSILGFDWTPAMYPVELWLNGRYDGVYCLSEHKKVASGRVNIKVPEDEGRDMYLEVDQLMDETTCFRTEKMNVPIMFSDPEIPSEEMLTETKAWFSDFEDALASESFADPSTGYAAYLDVPSFIDHYIIQELAKNIDGRMNKGAFMTRTQGGPVKICHEWDFDIAFGNCCNLTHLPGENNGPEGFLIKNWTGAYKDEGWYPRMFRDPAFVQKVKDRWNEVYPQLCGITAYIDSQASLLKDAADRNFTRWPILGQYVWPNVSYPATYSEEVANLKSFYTARLEWLNTNINAL